VAAPAVPAAAEYVAGRLERHAGTPGTLTVTIPAPNAAPESLLRLEGPGLGMGFLWDPPAAPAFSGVGFVHRVDLRGRGRFSDLKTAAREIWAGLRVETHPDCRRSPRRPRLFGGFAFAVGAATDDPWAPFGDGCFTLPRLLYERSPGGSTLTLAAEGRELASSADRRRLIALLEAALLELAVDRIPLPTTPELRLVEPSRPAWAEELEAIRRGIAEERFEKIVAARRTVVELGAPLDTVAVLRRLARGLVASTRFAFLRPHATFLGATPERLVALKGRELRTEALAGSIGRGHAEELLRSAKDRREHELVVDAIVRRLEPLCAELDVAPEATVRELREVLHLRTPIRGALDEPRHVLELVERLHPTPAVGGVPTDVALAWIAEREHDERGWYAAPVGWFDEAGDGEFMVALRSCVLNGRRAHLYAGAGIVRDSDPELEYTEMQLKNWALLRALGVVG
jgi:menaquinone-specific isochorismate synthase